MSTVPPSERSAMSKGNRQDHRQSAHPFQRYLHRNCATIMHFGCSMSRLKKSLSPDFCRHSNLNVCRDFRQLHTSHLFHSLELKFSSYVDFFSKFCKPMKYILSFSSLLFGNNYTTFCRKNKLNFYIVLCYIFAIMIQIIMYLKAMEVVHYE